MKREFGEIMVKVSSIFTLTRNLHEGWILRDINKYSAVEKLDANIELYARQFEN